MAKFDAGLLLFSINRTGDFNGRMHHMSTVTIHAEEELGAVAKELLCALGEKQQHAHVIALRGDLGAGKTALTKAIASELGITEHITSPTFVIMKSYPVSGHPFLTSLTHIDAYRIDDEDEMRVLGFHELLRDPRVLVCIEWPERIQDLIPPDAWYVDITLNESGERIITYGE